MFPRSIMSIILPFLLTTCGVAQDQHDANPKPSTEYGTTQKGTSMKEKVVKTDQEWRQLLTEDQYHVLREKGTERAFTGAFNSHKEQGVYLCAACGNELFSSEAKYESGCGWPSYYEPSSEDAVQEEPDRSYGMVRTEILCSRCGGHLGHVFDDGPKPTGLRYCINSAALKFEKK